MDLYDELTAVVGALEDAGIEYALCGGIAVAFHGYPRFTKDIDLLVRAEDVDRIRTVISGLGFSAPASPMRFQAGSEGELRVHRISKFEGEAFFTLDLLVPGPGLEPVFQERQRFPWKGKGISVVSASGLIRMKRLAGRDQDLLDIKKLGGAND